MFQIRRKVASVAATRLIFVVDELQDFAVDGARITFRLHFQMKAVKRFVHVIHHHLIDLLIRRSQFRVRREALKSS